jgi:CDP-paratose 2-epimerase
MRILITGSSGLIGSEAVVFFENLGCDVVGVDNNMRASLFGPSGDTSANRHRLETSCQGYRHIDLDIRDRQAVDRLLATHRPDILIHAAAQPSHDLAALRPFEDFDVNASGTLNLLEGCRQHCPNVVFIHLSTNKVYGDGPNHIPLTELTTRWDYADPAYGEGIPETSPVDQCLHSLFGASKLAGDVLAQEYGRYFGLKTGIFRGSCLTGPQHAGVELHGFLSYLVTTALEEKPYTIFGHKGKQVRDQIHSHDVVSAQNPRPGEVYNLGGGKENAASLLECVELVEQASGKRPRLEYQEQPRIGDHICYYSDLRKLKQHYPEWRVTYTLPQIVEQMVAAQRAET